MGKKLPFGIEKIKEINKEHKTPFYIYDEEAIRKNAKYFMKTFGKLNGFKQFYAVKANPNPFILKILREEGMGVDCSSMAELIVAEKTGFSGEEIMFSSNDTPAEEFVKAREMGAIINLDDFSHIEFLEKTAGLPSMVCFRYNPGPSREGNVIIGDPKEAKYGFTKEQLFSGYKILKEKGVKKFGLHTMVVSNELKTDVFLETAQMMFSLAAEISKELDITFEFVNLGGGMGIPYKLDEAPLAIETISTGMKERYDKNLKDTKVYVECGRIIMGPYGYLVTSVRHLKHIYKDYIGTDACMANLMRPGIYGAYHHISVLGKENIEPDHVYDVTGSLCENNDKFAIDRKLPEVEVGDILVMHDSGAHGHSMGFNYNGKLRSAEILLRKDGSFIEIRRAETNDDYFATIDFETVKEFK